jgi:hypothetical protein
MPTTEITRTVQQYGVSTPHRYAFRFDPVTPWGRLKRRKQERRFLRWMGSRPEIEGRIRRWYNRHHMAAGGFDWGSDISVLNPIVYLTWFAIDMKDVESSIPWAERHLDSDGHAGHYYNFVTHA